MYAVGASRAEHDEAGRSEVLVERKHLVDGEPPHADDVGMIVVDRAITASAERGNGQARGYVKTLLPRFAVHPATGELDGVGIKRFPETVRRPREKTRLF